MSEISEAYLRACARADKLENLVRAAMPHVLGRATGTAADASALWNEMRRAVRQTTVK